MITSVFLEGLGYHDDGEEDFFAPDMNAEEPLVDDKAQNGKAKGKRGRGALSSDAMKRAKMMNQSKLGGGKNQKVSKMFVAKAAMTVGPGSLSGKKKKKPSVAQADLDMDLDNMLKDLSANPVTLKKAKGSKKKKARQSGTLHDLSNRA
jgi:hypothetical protein